MSFMIRMIIQVAFDIKNFLIIISLMTVAFSFSCNIVFQFLSHIK